MTTKAGDIIHEIPGNPSLEGAAADRLPHTMREGFGTKARN